STVLGERRARAGGAEAYRGVLLPRFPWSREKQSDALVRSALQIRSSSKMPPKDTVIRCHAAVVPKGRFQNGCHGTLPNRRMLTFHSQKAIASLNQFARILQP